LAALDDKTHEKLIAQDKLKAEKVKDALEKTHLKEVERKKKQDDKAKEKAEKGKEKPEKGKDKTEKGKEKTEKENDKKTNV
jgi:penicillin-binding protein 2A